MTTMISISRVPLKSMKVVRLTCKTWNNLSKSESFTKMHIRKTTTDGEAMVIMMIPQNLYLMRGVVDDVDPSIELKGKLSFLNNQVTISKVFHNEGLLLCILKDTTKVVVWNPYLGQTRWIELRYSHSPYGFDMFNYALGYEDKGSCRSVKLLRFIDYFYKAPKTKFFWYEIYDFDSGLWTTLDVTPHWFIFCSCHSVSLKGNSYWCANDRSPENGPVDHIICFDFTREKFGSLLPLPVDVKDHDYCSVTLSCVKEEKIAALFQHHASYLYCDIEIWITTKIEPEMVSWSKFLRMDTRPKIISPHCFFIDEEKKVFMGFGTDFDCFAYPKKFIQIIGEAGYVKKLDLKDQNVCPRFLKKIKYVRPRMCSYVPSLVQIKKLARGKTIEQNSLENHRFNQYMLRLAAIRDW